MNNLREMGDLGVVVVAGAICAAPVAVKSLLDFNLVKTVTVVAAGVLGGTVVSVADMAAYQILQNLPLGDMSGPFVAAIFMGSIPITFVAGSFGAAVYTYMNMV